MDYRRTLTARKIAVFGIIAVCATGIGGAAAWIIGGPITGTTHVNSAQISLSWAIPDTTSSRWIAGHGHDHIKLYDVIDPNSIPPTIGFVHQTWIGPHYALDVTANYYGTADIPWDVTISLKITGAIYVSSGSVTVRECHDPGGFVWSDMRFNPISGGLEGTVLTQPITAGASLLISLDVVFNPMMQPQDLTFSVSASVN